MSNVNFLDRVRQPENRILLHYSMLELRKNSQRQIYKKTWVNKNHLHVQVPQEVNEKICVSNLGESNR